MDVSVKVSSEDKLNYTKCPDKDQVSDPRLLFLAINVFTRGQYFLSFGRHSFLSKRFISTSDNGFHSCLYFRS